MNSWKYSLHSRAVFICWGLIVQGSVVVCAQSVPTTVPSAMSRGIGQLGVAWTGGGVFSAFYNPANIPDGNDYQLSYHPDSDPKWFLDGVHFHHQAVQIGIPLRSFQGNLGISYFRSSLMLEALVIEEIGLTLKQFEVMDVFSIGLQRRWSEWPVPLMLAAGAGLRFFRIDPFSLTPTETLNNNWYDAGLLVSMPWQGSISGLTFEITPSVGYSLVNTGGGIAWPGFPEGIPPPTTGRLGYALSTAIGITYPDFDLVAWRFSREAEALLIEIGSDQSDWHLGPILGDIDVGQHLVDGVPSERVAIHEGAEWSLLGLYSQRSGTILLSAGGSEPVGAENLMRGYSVHIQPVWKILERLLKLPAKYRFARYFDLQYDSATQDIEIFQDTIEHTSVTFTLMHMGELLDRLQWGS